MEPASVPPAAELRNEEPETLDATGAGSVDEEFPDWEELTPELFEDECIRGDFMLRWAVILLAVLFGCTYLTETRLLVQIRSGEYMAGHGVLPPRADVFSATAGERSWKNFGWLSDLLLSGVHGLTGMTGLSLLGALTVGLTFWVLARIQQRNVSTWWSSFCAAVALVAVFPIVQPGSATITLLALAVLLALCHRWTVKPGCKLLWGLPVLMLLWSNFDARAWVGLLLLVMFAIGQFVAARQNEPANQKRNWLIVGLSLLAGVLVSPWPGHIVMAWRNQGLAQVEHRLYASAGDFFGRLLYGLADRQYWLAPDIFSMAAMALLIVSFISFGLALRLASRSRGLVPASSLLPWGLVWLTVNLLSLKYGDMVCYAALVNAVIAGLNGQTWYRHVCSQEFKVETWPVFYSRAGRAGTVLGFFVLAYLAINGALMGPASRRIGLGLDPRWRNRISNLETQVIEKAGENVFPTMPDLGDLLIWLGHKPFIDSRYPLYVESPNLAALHREVRGSLFNRVTAEPEKEPASEAPKPEGEAKAEAKAETKEEPKAEAPAAPVEKAAPAEKKEPLWKDVLAKYEMRDVMTRLWGSPPPYSAFFQLLTNSDFSLVAFAAAGADFQRIDIQDEAGKEAAQQNRLTRFVSDAFRPARPPELTDMGPTWPAPLSTYDRWLIQKIPVYSPAAELASHYSEIANVLGELLNPQQLAALDAITVRECRQALQENPNQVLPYRVLTRSFQSLRMIEQQAVLAGGGEPTQSMRDYQALIVAHNAVRAGGREQRDLLTLFGLLVQQQKLDTAKAILDEIEASRLQVVGANAEEQQKRLAEVDKQLTEHITQVRQQISAAREARAERGELVTLAVSARCPSLAVSILEEDLTSLTSVPQMRLLYASLLMDVGRIADAYDQLEGMSQMMPKPPVPAEAIATVTQWQNLTALANLCAFDNQRAEQLWGEDQRTQRRSSLTSLIHQPFAAVAPAPQLDLWAPLAGRVSFSAMFEIPERWADLQVERAIAEMEAGRLKSGQDLLENVLKVYPPFSKRGLVVFYLIMLTGKPYDLAPPIPQDTDMDYVDYTEPEAPPAAEAVEGRPEPPALPVPLE